MKLKISREAIAGAMAQAGRIVERRTTIPILSNVKLVAAGGRLTISASDLDLELVLSIPADVESPGEITVPSQMLGGIASKLPKGADLQMEMADTGLKVVSGRARFTLATIPASDFPELASRDSDINFMVSASALTSLVDPVQFAISTEETRYYLNGVYLHVEEGEIRAVATDGHRLAKVTGTLPDGAEGAPGIIVPRKTVDAALRLASGMKGDIQISVSESTIRFVVGDTTLTSKLIDGTFPDYGRVIPRNGDRRAIIDVDALRSAVDLVTAIVSERGNAVKLSFRDDLLELRVRNPDAGDAADEIAIEWNGPPMAIGFNTRYLTEAIAEVTSDQVAIDMSDPGAPALLREYRDGAPSEDAVFVLMPMRV